MYTIHLQVQDDYIEELMSLLPKDKVRIIEENFKENTILLQNELKNYKENSSNFTSYFDNMKNVDVWLDEKQI